MSKSKDGKTFKKTDESGNRAPVSDQELAEYKKGKAARAIEQIRNKVNRLAALLLDFVPAAEAPLSSDDPDVLQIVANRIKAKEFEAKDEATKWKANGNQEEAIKAEKEQFAYHAIRRLTYSAYYWKANDQSELVTESKNEIDRKLDKLATFRADDLIRKGIIPAMRYNQTDETDELFDVLSGRLLYSKETA